MRLTELLLHKFNFYIFCLISLLISLYFGENSSGGSYLDYKSTQKFIEAFDQNLFDGFRWFIINDQIHFPFFYILKYYLIKFFSQPILHIIYIFLSSLIPYFLFKSIYLKLRNKFQYNWMQSKANWSFEAFNGYTKNSLNRNESMLAGARVIFSPIKGLDFELVQTSQWGGEGYSNGISALGAALLFDTNAGKNSNINKMAGFGISYLIPSNLIPLRIYGQAIGEDEAGSLPSCYAYLAGLEWSNTKIKYPTTIGFEVLDTRINQTKHGNCGPNTIYNNATYDYINYGNTMGAPIDTEGNSLEFFGKSQISEKLNIKFSTKLITINDTNWAGHRLSSKRQSGIMNTFGAIWSRDNVRLTGDIFYQGFNLDKANIKSGSGVSFSSSIIF